MIALAGFLIVIGAVVGGYLMEHGILMLLFQPAEFVIIGGAGLGIIAISAPVKTIKLMISQIAGMLKPGYNNRDYMDLLVMLKELLNLTRREGLLAIEQHIEEPDKSSILAKYPKFLKNHHAVDFFCDTMRLILTDPEIQAHELEALLDLDLESHHERLLKPSKIIQMVGEAMPGLGIVAAVLGVVLTMQAIGGEIEVVGEKVGAALVGTFLGVLLSYGFMQPLAANLTAKIEEDAQYYIALKQVLVSFRKGSSPAVAVEFARRSIGSDLRPGFTEIGDAVASPK